MSARKYDYIKVADRQRIVREAAGKNQDCNQCGKRTKNLYWASAAGVPLTMPICNACFEDELRRLTRDDSKELEELSTK